MSKSICFYFQVHQPYRLRTYRFRQGQVRVLVLGRGHRADGAVRTRGAGEFPEAGRYG